jgi:hypothetical protein
MSLILFLLAIALLGVAGWGFQSVMTELAKPYPHEPFDTVSRRFEVEGFIWSSRAPRALRRQYIATQACFVPAALCLAALVWLNEMRPDFRLWGAVIFCTLSLFMACRLAWAVIRHRD